MSELHAPTLHAEHLFQLGPIPVTNSILGTWVAMALLLSFLFIATRRPQLVPTGTQNMLEILVEQFRGLVRDVTGSGKQTRKYLPLVVSIFLFVLFVNWVGLIPGFGTVLFHGQAGEVPLLRAGSSDLNLTLALAALSFIFAQHGGIVAIGFFKYFGKFVNLKRLFTWPPSPKNLALLLPEFFLGLIELISELAKLVSLSFRLFGNIYAGEVLLVVFAALLPVFVPLSGPFYLLEVFVGLIQAFVFAMLTIVFIKIASLANEH